MFVLKKSRTQSIQQSMQFAASEMSASDLTRYFLYCMGKHVSSRLIAKSWIWITRRQNINVLVVVFDEHGEKKWKIIFNIITTTQICPFFFFFFISCTSAMRLVSYNCERIAHRRLSAEWTPIRSSRSRHRNQTYFYSSNQNKKYIDNIEKKIEQLRT